MLNFFKNLVLVPVLIIGVPIAFVAKLFERPINRSREEVESIFHEMATGKPSDDLWDAFLSVPIKDKRLDQIREKVEVLWAYEEFQMKNEDGLVVLNSRGLAELNLIHTELRNESKT